MKLELEVNKNHLKILLLILKKEEQRAEQIVKFTKLIGKSRLEEEYSSINDVVTQLTTFIENYPEIKSELIKSLEDLGFDKNDYFSEGDTNAK